MFSKQHPRTKLVYSKIKTTKEIKTFYKNISTYIKNVLPFKINLTYNENWMKSIKKL